MKIYIKFLICFFIFSTLFSCIKPPSDVDEVNLITLAKQLLDELNDIKENPKKSLEFFKNLTSNFHAIITFKNGTGIYISSKEATPNSNDFAHTLNNNSFIINKSLYITYEDKDFIYSFDKKVWYSNKSDANKEIEGIKNDYYFDTKIIDEDIHINYSMSFDVGRAPKMMVPSKDKLIVELKKGMIFSNVDENKVNTDLKKCILYVPKGTILSGIVNVDGNIIKSEFKDNIISIEAIQDIFIYIKKNIFSISLDKKSWDVNILSFNIEPDFNVKAVEDKHIFFDIEVTANYFKDEISFSIVRLLLRAM